MEIGTDTTYKVMIENFRSITSVMSSVVDFGIFLGWKTNFMCTSSHLKGTLI